MCIVRGFYACDCTLDGWWGVLHELGGAEFHGLRGGVLSCLSCSVQW